MKKESVLKNGVLLVLLLSIVVIANHAIYGQIESPRYSYGSYSVEVSHELFTGELIRKAELELLKVRKKIMVCILERNSLLLIIKCSLMKKQLNILRLYWFKVKMMQ